MTDLVTDVSVAVAVARKARWISPRSVPEVTDVAPIASLADGSADAVDADGVTRRAVGDAFDHLVQRRLVNVEPVSRDVGVGDVRKKRLRLFRVDGEAKVGVPVAVVEARHLDDNGIILNIA